jgi:acetolactate synthase I/II/III large subunit
MNGAESLVHTAIAAGVRVCFANPGTTELDLVKALDDVPGLRAVLGLFEGVCSGAADGYGRMLDVPALTLLHLGPGLSNAAANLHNARRARSPVVNLVGEHATWHRGADAPLTSDIAAMAGAVSRWVRTTSTASRLGGDAAEAIASARGGTGGVATLIVPADCQGGDAAGPARPIDPAPLSRVPAARVERVAATLRAGPPAALLVGGKALRARGQWAAARVAALIGCRVVAEVFPARMERGAGLPRIERLPYFPDRVAASLAGLSRLVLAGAPEPVSFFGYPGAPSRLTPEGCALLSLASPEEDAEAALEALADALDAPPASPALAFGEMPLPLLEGALTAETIGPVLAALQPEGAIVVDESTTTGAGYFHRASGSPRHDYLSLTGGSIGMGPACAVGAAIACPDRTVVNLQGDGGAMYTPQALWTQARESLHVVTLVCANRSYRILQLELARAGVASPGPLSRSLVDLSRPRIDWTQLARGMGVEARSVDDVASLRQALARALAEPGPHLVEMVMAEG